MATDLDHYLTDYWTTEDNLRFSDFRPALFNILTQAQTPLTIGVFGPWGNGKTSLLRMLKGDVEKKNLPSLRAVWFTAWKYDRHEAPWRAFILRVLDALYPRESGDAPWEERERIPVDKLNNKQTKQVKYLDRLSSSLYRPVTWEEKGGWTMAWDEAGKELAKLPAFLLLLAAGSDKVADKLGITPDMAQLLQREVQAQRLEQLASMEQFEATFKDALAEILGPDGRLVVFVDDLDRCCRRRQSKYWKRLSSSWRCRGQPSCWAWTGWSSSAVSKPVTANASAARTTSGPSSPSAARLISRRS
jgi:hypothetical protein